MIRAGNVAEWTSPKSAECASGAMSVVHNRADDVFDTAAAGFADDDRDVKGLKRDLQSVYRLRGLVGLGQCEAVPGLLYRLEQRGIDAGNVT
jgi:hypothetical protein